jgi:hypothetical protein
VSTLRACRSANIVECYGAVAVPGTSRLLVGMELMAVSAGELAAAGAAAGGGGGGGGPALPEPLVAYVLREALNALVYLHSGHRIHRDVKAANRGDRAVAGAARGGGGGQRGRGRGWRLGVQRGGRRVVSGRTTRSKAGRNLER